MNVGLVLWIVIVFPIGCRRQEVIERRLQQLQQTDLAQVIAQVRYMVNLRFLVVMFRDAGLGRSLWC